MAIPRPNKLSERDEPNRKSALKRSGQKGFLRSIRNWMIRLGGKFKFGMVTRVYLLTTMKPIAEELFIVCTGGG
jgi:hypothetical protein